MWAKLDVNKDGKLDQADRAAKMAERFAAIDTDKNGSISREEFAAHHQQMKDGPVRGDKPGMPPAGAGMDHGRMGHGKMGHGKMGGRGHHMMGGGMHMIGLADANKDGTVTRAEFDAGVKAHFDKADTNKDGKVSPEERRAAMKDMMGKMRGPRSGGAPGAMGDGPPPPPPAN
jgi:hypothetical protein